MRTIIQTIVRYLRCQFNFTQGQFRGFLVLAFLTVVSVIFRIYLPGYLFPAADRFGAHQRLIDSLHHAKSGPEKPVQHYTGSNSFRRDEEKAPAAEIHRTLFAFDPNRICADSLRLLGFNALARTSLVRYREKNGRIRKKEDLLRIYGVDSAIYMRLKDFIMIGTMDTMGYEGHTKMSCPMVALNTATAAELELLPGIGPVFANRIIKYRHLLGGFFQAEQLMEVYGMDTSRMEQFISYIRIDTHQLRFLDLNRMNEWELSRHPYLDKKHAHAIVRYREYEGKIGDPYDLLQYKIVDSNLFGRLRPYIMAEPSNKRANDLKIDGNTGF